MVHMQEDKYRMKNQKRKITHKYPGKNNNNNKNYINKQQQKVLYHNFGRI